MDKISDSLGMRPLEVALEGEHFDDITADITVVNGVLEDDPDADPYFDQAAADAAMVRDNLLGLLKDGAELFQDAKMVAMNTQDPDQYGSAARMYSELIKANKELMSVHKDIFGLKPAPVEQPKQQANTINNIMINGGANEIMALLAKNGIEPRKTKGSIENDPDADPDPIPRSSRTD